MNFQPAGKRLASRARRLAHEYFERWSASETPLDSDGYEIGE